MARLFHVHTGAVRQDTDVRKGNISSCSGTSEHANHIRYGKSL